MGGGKSRSRAVGKSVGASRASSAVSVAATSTVVSTARARGVRIQECWGCDPLGISCIGALPLASSVPATQSKFKTRDLLEIS